jgi:hypothetical protein
MDAYNSAGISRQTFPGSWGSDVLLFAEFDDIVPVFFIELLMLFEFDVILDR